MTAVVVLAGPDASAAAVGAALAVVLALTSPHVRAVAALGRSARQRY